MKLTNYLMIISTMVLTLEFLGIPTGVSLFLSNFNIDINPTTAELVSFDIENSGFFLKFFAENTGILLTLGAIGAVIIGFFARGYDVSIIIVGGVVFITGILVSTMVILMGYVNTTLGQAWLTKIIGVIFIPLTIGLIWSAVGYFSGRD